MGPVRKGVGKLVASCDQPPLVVPFVHSGMEQVMPRGKALPNVGKKVRRGVGAGCGGVGRGQAFAPWRGAPALDGRGGESSGWWGETGGKANGASVRGVGKLHAPLTFS